MRREVDERRKRGQVWRGNCKRLIFNYNLPARAGSEASRRSVRWDLPLETKYNSPITSVVRERDVL